MLARLTCETRTQVDIGYQRSLVYALPLVEASVPLFLPIYPSLARSKDTFTVTRDCFTLNRVCRWRAMDTLGKGRVSSFVHSNAKRSGRVACHLPLTVNAGFRWLHELLVNSSIDISDVWFTHPVAYKFIYALFSFPQVLTKLFFNDTPILLYFYRSGRSFHPSLSKQWYKKSDVKVGYPVLP